MNTTVLNAINEQINSEFEASYSYLAMAAFCDRFLKNDASAILDLDRDLGARAGAE